MRRNFFPKLPWQHRFKEQ